MQDETTMKVFPLRIPAEMYDAIQELAKKNTRSMNAEIKEILHSEVPMPSMSCVDRTPLLKKDSESKEQWIQRTISECLGTVNNEAFILSGWIDKQIEQTSRLNKLQKKCMEKDAEGVLELLRKIKRVEVEINKNRNKQVMLVRYFTNEYLQHLEGLLAVDDSEKTA